MLGRILLLQNSLHVAPDEQRLAEMAVHGLCQIPGVMEATICLSGRIVATTIDELRLPGIREASLPPDCESDIHIVDCPPSRRDTPERKFHLATSHIEFGVLQFQLGDASAFEPYVPFVSNTVNLIALQLENKQTTKQLQSANETLESMVEERNVQYRMLFENMAEGVIYKDEAGRIVSANPAAERILGFNRDQIIGRSATEFDPATIYEDGSDFPGDQHPTTIALSTGMEVSDKIMGILNPRTNEFAWLNINAVPLFRRGESHPYQVFATFRDITEQKRAVESLRQSEAKIRSILDNIGIGVALINPDMKIVELNHQMRGWFAGIEPGCDCHQIVCTSSREHICINCPVKKTLHDGQVHDIAMTAQLMGHRHNFRVISSPVLNASGEITAAIALYEDITEKLSLESQLRQAQKMEAIGRLAGGIAHDFNNMLGVIMGYTELALQCVDPSQEFGTALLEVQKAAFRSADLTKQLLAFARKQIAIPKVLNLNNTIDGMFKMLQRLIGEDITLAWLPTGGLWWVMLDPSQVDQILANLCVNARDAIAGIGKVTIETQNVTFDELYCSDHSETTPGDYVLLAVSDNGCGMDRKTVERLFEPFFTTKEAGRGTGLGLSTVYGIVKQNNGFINIYSEPGHGSTFKIYFPRHTAEVETHGEEATSIKTVQGNEVVLVVEDEASLLNMTRSALENFGYRVLAAATPSQAITFAKEYDGSIELLMTDVIMPEMNGLELAKLIRASCPAIKVLFMSGYTSNVIVHHGVLDEGVDYLQKPFTMQLLANKVREVLEKE